MTLDELMARVEGFLYLPNRNPFYVALASVAANRHQPADWDMVWPFLVGPPSCGKSEIIDAFRELPDCHPVSRFTEAGLLSGSPQRERAADATGGLLHQIGKRGILLVSDFTLVLSQRADRRDDLISLFRDIYTGRLERALGADGGKMCVWTGKLGFLAGVTEVIDDHHATIAKGGDRFIYSRFTSLSARQKQERYQFSLRQQAEWHRDHLTEAIIEFMEQERSAPPVLPIGYEQKLIALSDLATTARSPVERDWRTREIVDFHEPEYADRLMKQLRGLRWGLRYIGLTEKQTWDVVSSTAVDCVPRLKGRIIELLSSEAVVTQLVAQRVGRPILSVRRALEELECFGVVRREHAANRSHGDRWSLADHFKDAYADSLWGTST